MGILDEIENNRKEYSDDNQEFYNEEISETALFNAKKFLSQLPDEMLEYATASVESDGYIDVEWRTGKRSFSVSFGPKNMKAPWVYLEDGKFYYGIDEFSNGVSEKLLNMIDLTLKTKRGKS
ncbi:MAG: hypothetical protein ACOCQD_00955 [archaeon]